MQNYANAKSNLDPRCDSNALLFREYPNVKLDYLNEITQLPPARELEGSLILTATSDGGFRIPKRPLFGLLRMRSDSETRKTKCDRSQYAWVCSKENLAIDLQTAMELEWATIPTYLNGWYSIKRDHNTNISATIQSIVIEEMKHFNLVANMLIAMNVNPVIKSNIAAPHFPVRGLPGSVLPNLTVNMEKLSIDYIFKVYMGIEVPLKTEVAGDYSCKNCTCFTIGAFYDEIKGCITQLNNSGEDIFDPKTKNKQPIHLGIKPILSAADAMDAVDLIVSEGEGSGTISNCPWENSSSFLSIRRNSVWKGTG